MARKNFSKVGTSKLLITKKNLLCDVLYNRIVDVSTLAFMSVAPLASDMLSERFFIKVPLQNS
jgi:hypothetical protein